MSRRAVTAGARCPCPRGRAPLSPRCPAGQAGNAYIASRKKYLARPQTIDPSGLS
jgi:hypothetical protein